MKLNNVDLSKPKPKEITVYRNPPIVLYAEAVLDYSPFEELAPEPKPPITTNIKTKIQFPDVNNPKFRERLRTHNTLRTNWLIFTSLTRGTPDLDFETVDPTDPETWANVRTELAETFTPYEMGEIISGVMDANAPTKESYEEALANFPATPQEEESQQSSPTGEQKSSGIGELVSDWESDQQESQSPGTT